MKRFSNARRANLLRLLGAWVMLVMPGGLAAAAPAPAAPNESEFLSLGFKVMVAETKVQKDWVRSLPAGKIRAMQRNGKKYFIYPDAAKNQIFVGGPKEHDAYLQLHPDTTKKGAQEAANREYRLKQDKVMREATARDYSDPFLGASWSDFIY